MRSIVFNGRSLADFKCLVDERSSLVHPEMDMQKVEVPGRNGDLYLSNHRYKNLTITYSCMIDKTFYENYNPLMSFLLQDGEYHRLEGNAEKEFFRMARFTKSSDPVVGDFFQRGTFKLSFDCKPQKWRKDGEKPTVFTGNGVLYNGFLYPAKPLIRIYGYGTVKIGSGSITVYDDGEYVDVDCDIKDASRGPLNMNSAISVGTWPELTGGGNRIEIPSTVSKIEITPRWVTI